MPLPTALTVVHGVIIVKPILQMKKSEVGFSGKQILRWSSEFRMVTGDDLSRPSVCGQEREEAELGEGEAEQQYWLDDTLS